MIKEKMVYEFERLGFESQDRFSFPNIVNLCVIRGSCPCQCVHCPVGITPGNQRFERFGKSTISTRLFEKIVREMAGFPHASLRIHGVGEPILWKELANALQFTKKNNVRTWLFTSLVTDDIPLLEKLAQYCDIIEISVNSFDEKDYRKTKRINEFSLVKHNIEILRTTGKQKKFSTRIIVSRVESEDKSYDSAFVRYWKTSDLVDDAFVRTYHDYNALLDKKFAGKRTEIIPCLVHWARFNIDCDGTVVLCFNELFKGMHPGESLVLGDTRDQSIEEIWHGEKLNLVRSAQREKDYSIVTFADQLPCIGCSSCQSSVQKDKPTSESQVNALMNENKKHD